VATWYLGGHLAFIWVSTWRYREHLASSCARSISFGGHIVFWWPPGISFRMLRRIGCHLEYWWAASISFGGQLASWWVPGLYLDGHLNAYPEFFTRWPPGISLTTQHFLLWAPGTSVFTQHFVCWAYRVVVANCHLDRQPAFILVATWHLLLWAAGVSFGGHLTFWVPPGILVGTLWYFWWVRGVLVTSWHLVGHAAFLLLVTLSCGGYPVFLLVGMWH